MDEKIDLAAVIEQLQADNEKLRERLAYIQFNPPTFAELASSLFFDIVSDNFFWIGVLVGLVGLAAVQQLWRKYRER